MSLNQDEFVRLLGDFYEFYDRVFWTTGIGYPPPLGWPTITPSTLGRLQLDNKTLELLRRIPYPRSDPNYDSNLSSPLIMPNTGVCDYRSSVTQAHLRDGTLPVPYGPDIGLEPRLPPSCVCLASSHGNTGSWVVVDTDDGLMYWGERTRRPVAVVGETVTEPARSSDADWWRERANVYRPAELFELCKQRYRDMAWIGVGRDKVSGLLLDLCWVDNTSWNEGHIAAAAAMMEAGWPGDREGGGWDRDMFRERFVSWEGH